MSFGVEVGYAAGASAIVDQNFFHHALGAQFTISGGERDGDHGILRSVLRIHFAGKSAAPTAAHAGATPVVGNAVARHGNMKRMQAQTLGRRLQNPNSRVGGSGGMGRSRRTRTMKRRGRVVSRDANFVFGFLIERLQVVIGDGPVFQ